MNSIEANIRSTKTKGELNSLRSKGIVPGIVYGGKEQNQNVSFSKKNLKTLLEKDNFLSNTINLKIDGKDQNVLPREVVFDILSDEPIHVDFLRIVKDGNVTLEIPVKFINSENSPGLKRGGVLNIVRRKVELKCPTDNIPTELIVDLDGVDIGQSFKISSIKLPENVHPTIQGRDFVVATLAAPTIIKEPEKPAESAEGVEGAAEGGDAPPAEGGVEGEAKAGSSEGEKGDKKEESKKAKGEEKKSPTEKK